MMQPYYQDEAVTIYHGDCRDILPHLPKVDLVLTDPPYGVGFDYGNEYDDNPQGYHSFLWPILEEAERHIINDGYIGVFVAGKHATKWAAWFPREWRLLTIGRSFGQWMPTHI